jgi:hypothetical protein
VNGVEQLWWRGELFAHPSRERHVMAHAQEIEELAVLLLEAARRCSAINGPIWSTYESGKEMAGFLIQCQQEMRAGSLTTDQKRRLLVFFSPTCDWDDVGGDSALGNRVFSALERLYANETGWNRGDSDAGATL